MGQATPRLKDNETMVPGPRLSSARVHYSRPCRGDAHILGTCAIATLLIATMFEKITLVDLTGSCSNLAELRARVLMLLPKSESRDATSGTPEDTVASDPTPPDPELALYRYQLEGGSAIGARK